MTFNANASRLLLGIFLMACPFSSSLAASFPVANDIAATLKARNAGVIGTPFDITCTALQSFHEETGPVIVSDATGSTPIRNGSPTPTQNILDGDRLQISGRIIHTRERGGTDYACATNITVLTHGNPPAPRSVTASEINAGTIKPYEIVTTSATIIDADVDDVHAKWATFMMRADGVQFYVVYNRPQDEPLDLVSLVGKRVSVVGLYHNVMRSVRSTIDRAISINTRKAFKLHEQAAVNPFDAAELRKDDIPSGRRTAATEKRRTSGRVLAVWDRRNVLLRPPSIGIVRCELSMPDPPECGAYVQIAGYPTTDMLTPVLIHALWRPITLSLPAETKPVDASGNVLQSQDFGGRQFDLHYYGRLVRMTGTICSMSTDFRSDILFLRSDDQIVKVDVSSCPNALAGLEIGSTVAVTGVCVFDTENMSHSDVFPRVSGYRIVPRRASDILLVSRPPWWTPARLGVVIAALVVAMLGFIVWVRTLNRRVERRSRELFHEQVAHCGTALRIDERTRLAVELHDALSQTLTGIALLFDSAADEAATPSLRRFFAVARQMLASCRKELKGCLWDLRTRTFEEKDMTEALRRTLQPYADEACLQIRFNVPREILSETLAHDILRIVRELVVNALRHGRAGKIKVAGSVEGRTLRFSVRDNGRGFRPDSVPGIADGHFGLQGIRERMKVLGGTVEVTSGRDVGTKVRIDMPLPTEKGEKV